jgi:hypothetical protein
MGPVVAEVEAAVVVAQVGPESDQRRKGLATAATEYPLPLQDRRCTGPAAAAVELGWLPSALAMAAWVAAVEVQWAAIAHQWARVEVWA